MSYDVTVWTVEANDISEIFSAANGWRKAVDGGSVLEGKGWQLLSTALEKVEVEDIPVELHNVMPGIQYRVDLTLEPLDAPSKAKKQLETTAAAIAKRCHGLVFDPQTDEVVTPKGLKRFVPTPRAERFSLLQMSWWSVERPLLQREGVVRFLNALSTYFPEALPRRYGQHEPPQHKLENESLEHLAHFISQNLASGVFYPVRPAVGFSLSYASDLSHPRLGFRCGLVKIGVESSVLTQPGWQDGLRRFWRAASIVLQPFFGEVRTLDGFIRRGATYGVDVETDVEPVRSWFWRGVPRELGHAVVIGKPYVDLWPEFMSKAVAQDGLFFTDGESWTKPHQAPVTAPEEIKQLVTPRWVEAPGGGRHTNWNEGYPVSWPFERVEVDKK